MPFSHFLLRVFRRGAGRVARLVFLSAGVPLRAKRGRGVLSPGPSPVALALWEHAFPLGPIIVFNICKKPTESYNTLTEGPDTLTVSRPHILNRPAVRTRLFFSPNAFKAKKTRKKKKKKPIKLSSFEILHALALSLSPRKELFDVAPLGPDWWTTGEVSEGPRRIGRGMQASGAETGHLRSEPHTPVTASLQPALPIPLPLV
ncbi:hypothetical protein SKAU_G00387840 [Synaphobranchus kaupii]|uniref:Uncharacterized protein n=1 Tax=Synaphobranchus kaupii TaxID=118154 RepID=A0A9Q1EAW4_SYNKA|nr:hypothetical protein SKAU_G00387840 [Synaphobranchus kaupii]